MNRRIGLTAFVVAVLALVSSSANAEPAVHVADGMVVDAAGMTTYSFDKDVANSGKSACNGPCAALWPPVLAAADAHPEGSLTLVRRDDGNTQWAYEGKPIYTYSADKKPGDMSGDNFKNVWHVVK